MIAVNALAPGTDHLCSNRFKQTIMTPTENLYYALGEVAYAVAKADGRIQNDEVKKFHPILETELELPADSLSVADIIFHILDKDHVDAETAYQNGLHQLQLYSHHLTPEMKLNFLHVAEKIAQAFPPRLNSENHMIARFRADIAQLKGDPLFCKTKKS